MLVVFAVTEMKKLSADLETAQADVCQKADVVVWNEKSFECVERQRWKQSCSP